MTSLGGPWELVWNSWNNEGEIPLAKIKGATDCSVAPGFVPSPRYFANFLLHDGVGQAAPRSHFGLITRCPLFESEHGVLHRAEIADSGLVPILGCGTSRIAQRRRAA